ncbi:MAG: hypothetical protein WBA89_16440 [Microcoleus sp.]
MSSSKSIILLKGRSGAGRKRSSVCQLSTVYSQLFNLFWRDRDFARLFY